ncbi:hypothetical protein ABH973_006726 [Bradyrhizobium ottawaense]
MITWRDDGSRIVAMCGDAPVGAVFPTEGRRTGWRAWVTKNTHASEGYAADIAAAKREIENRFAGFLNLAKLQPCSQTEKPTRGGPTEAHPDAPYCKPDQSCCDFCCGN